MQRESGAPLAHCLRLLFQRFAACLSLAAAFAFFLNGALAFDPHVGGAQQAAIHHGGQLHAHMPADGQAHMAHHHHHHGDGGSGAHPAQDDNGTAPAPHSDGGSSCCCEACHVGVMLPRPSLQAEVPPLRADAMPSRIFGDGIEPEGLRKPPRPGAIL